MAASLGDLFDGAQTADGASDAQAITAGDWVLVVQGTLDGAKVNISGNVFDSTYDAIDGPLIIDNPGFRVFRFCAGNVKAHVSGAGTSTSVKVGILAAS